MTPSHDLRRCQVNSIEARDFDACVQSCHSYTDHRDTSKRDPSQRCNVAMAAVIVTVTLGIARWITESRRSTKISEARDHPSCLCGGYRIVAGHQLLRVFHAAPRARRSTRVPSDRCSSPCAVVTTRGEAQVQWRPRSERRGHGGIGVTWAGPGRGGRPRGPGLRPLRAIHRSRVASASLSAARAQPRRGRRRGRAA